MLRKHSIGYDLVSIFKLPYTFRIKEEGNIKAIKAAKEWQNAQQKPKTSPVSPKDLTALNTLPSVLRNTIRLFSDAAWNGSTLAGGFGWVASDAAESTLFEGNSAQRVVASVLSAVLSAKALALKAGITMAASAGIKDVVCFSDSRHLINIITGNKSVIELKGILHDLGVLSLSFSSISFRYVSRNCNEHADMLAKNALFGLNNPSRIGNSVT